MGAKSRQGVSLCGAFSFQREVFECPKCRKSFAPLDVELGMEAGEKFTRGVVRRAAWSGGKLAFRVAAENVKEMIGLEISPAECQRLAVDVGRRLDAEQRERENAYLAPVSPEHRAPKPEIAAKRLVMMADGVTVLTVAGEEHKNVYCGRAFPLEDRQRKEGASPGEEGRPFIDRSRHTASAVDMEDFGGRMKALGWRMGMRTAKAVAFVADGAAPLWNWARSNLPKETVMIQDIWHVLEHLADLGREVWGEEGLAERLERWNEALQQSRLPEILKELGEEHKSRRGAKRQRIEAEMGYLERASSRMDYARYLEQGWPIGSGAMEADCKHLVKERYGVTGARWKREFIFAVLALRLAIENKEWERVWTCN